MRRTIVLGFVLLLLTGCSTGQRTLSLAADEMLPAFLAAATPRVRDAYRFAIANPHDLAQYPCYCGCGKMGHTSNLSCYVSSHDADSAIAFDEHANGCGICVDITQDVMRLTQAGQPAWEIRAYVDAQYSRIWPIHRHTAAGKALIRSPPPRKRDEQAIPRAHCYWRCKTQQRWPPGLVGAGTPSTGFDHHREQHGLAGAAQATSANAGFAGAE